MLRRLKFFGLGALISIIFLSLGPENRLKHTFYSYIDYFNPEKRVIGQMMLADSTNFSTFDKEEINEFYEGSWVNHQMTNKDEYPQVFVLDNSVNQIKKRLTLLFFDNERKEVDGNLKRYTRVDVKKFEKVEMLAKRSYASYFQLLGIFLLIMIPASLLIRKLIRKRRMQDESN